MDREYYLRRYDEELAKAASATSEPARVAHEGLAKVFKDAAERVSSPRPITTSQAGLENRPIA